MEALGCQLPGCDDFEYLEEVGHGRFSEIYKARRRNDGLVVALKYLGVGMEQVSVQREVKALTLLDGCPHILQYHGIYENEFGVALALDIFPKDLWTVIKESEGMCTRLRIHVVKQMLKAVQECHANGIIHRDISPYNFLVNHDTNVVLADFGVSIQTAECNNRTPGMGTLWYMAPEILFGARQYTCASDVWSLGCVIAEVILQKPLWNGSSQLDQICKIIDDLGTPTEEIWSGLSALPDWGKLQFPPKDPKDWHDILPDSSSPSTDVLVDIVQGMLVYDPSKRLSLQQCIDKIDIYVT